MNDDKTFENDDNEEISVSHVIAGNRWNRKSTIIEDIFSYEVALDVKNENDDYEARSGEQCR